jgi:hypothetical protein
MSEHRIGQGGTAQYREAFERHCAVSLAVAQRDGDEAAHAARVDALRVIHLNPHPRGEHQRWLASLDPATLSFLRELKVC